jgi:predicted nucleic acid-binding protein
MSRSYAFWDASAIVALCVTQPQSKAAFGLLRKYRPVVWWATPVEITSAFTRLLREGEISARTYAKAQLQADYHASLWRVVAPIEQVVVEARVVLERFPLRAADAIQLAAALVWCGGRPNGRVFLTFDQKLAEAAELAGFRGA